MKPLVSIVFVTAVCTAGTALADVQVSDADGDGVFSMEELQAAIPDMTEGLFALVDTDGDGVVSPDELASAEAAGTIPQG
ncbi:MAG: EF-hand domain-containing protein [Pseudomonadota bacterium]